MENTNKGKSMNTSLPSIAVRFDASSEKLEELFQSGADSKKKQEEVKNRHTDAIGEPGSSPIHTSLNYTNRHSASTETGLAGHDLSPPSDRWKFFTDIKGKITKSVEDTITEIKLRNQDNETSSKKFKHSKDKDNCSLSDSDDMSESSISKTTEVISNTEGVEMSSDEETSSLEKDKTLPRKSSSDITQPTTLTLQQHKSSIKKKLKRENNISVTTLAGIYEINTGLKATTFKGSSLQHNENFEVESGVEAFEDTSFQNTSNVNNAKSDMMESPGPNHLEKTDEEIVSHIVETIDNISLEDEKVLNVRRVVGTEIRDSFLMEDADHTYLAPQGFVDLRDYGNETSWTEIIYSYRNIFAITGALVIYFFITIPVYLTGFTAGILFTLVIMNAYNKFFVCNVKETSFTDSFKTILEIPAAKEYQPLRKFEGWMNEFPGVYDPENYHICQTQSVYVRLQGNLLKISHTRSKIPKRSMWNEPKHKCNFTHHRIYNLLGAKVMLLPESLNRKRLWSKKYPICINLSKDQLNFSLYSDNKNLAREESKTSNVSVVETVSEKTKKESGHKKKYVAQHDCTLQDESDSYLPELPENASLFNKFCRQLTYLTVVSPANPQCKNYFRSKASIIAERKRQADLSLLHIIHPFSLFRTYWEIIMMVVLLLVLIFYPLDVAFSTELDQNLNYFSIFVLFLDMICLLDIAITFITGYGISTTKEVVLEPRKIITNYLLGKYFLLDLISSLPLELVQYKNTSLRSVVAVELLKIFRFRTFLLYMRRTADIWELNLLVFLSLRYLIVFLLLIHWTACMHYAVPYFVSSMRKSKVLDPDSWIVAAHINASTSGLDTYVQCVFRACCYLLCIGHGKNPVNTPEDYIMGILTLVIGYLFLAILLVLTLQIVSSVTSAETKYQEIINQVKEYMGYKQLPSTMQERLISYYEYRFRKSYFREDIISGALSERLRREINVHCYRKLVDSVSIFKDMHHHTVADIVNSLKSEIFLPNDIIVKAGSIGDCMYFLSSGTVCVVTPTGKEPQVFSKLTEEDEELDNESVISRISTPPSSDEISHPMVEDSLEEDVSDILKDIFESDEDQGDDDTLSLDEWGIVIQEEENMTQTCIYLFARSHREKEEWYQRFLMGTHKGAYLRSTGNLDMESQSRISDTLLNYFNYEEEYLRYMARFQKVLPFILLRRNLGNVQQSNKNQTLNNVTREETEQAASVLWINALVGRIVFDCQRNLAFSKLVIERIQRKLSSIKLPYFIEQITVSELSLGTTPFLIHRTNTPTLDHKGLWIDLDMTYDGTIILTVQTKLNLMKLKQPPVPDENKLNRCANWQSSDVDDTAESSTDDEAKFVSVTNKVSEDPSVATGTSAQINKSNKLFKMVDKIAESKFFQAAAENRYVKKALEGVSNTELGLKVELKGLVGTIVLNIPPPPSDRIWFGFRPIPKLWLSAQPMVGEKHIPVWKQISNWIEKKLIQEFQKVLVLPNMEDILIPAMSSTLPEQTM